MNEEIFWKLIEKNKYNPINFQEETENMSLEDMYKFMIIIQEMENAFKKDYFHFWAIMCNKHIYENGFLDDVIFRGQEFYNAFINEDEEKIKQMLIDNPNWKEPVMTIEAIEKIYGIKVATDDEIKRMNDNNELIHNCYLKFWDKIDKLGIKNKK